MGKTVFSFQNAYVQLAILCLEHFRVRELHDIFSLERLCHDLHKEQDQRRKKTKLQDIFQAIKDVFKAKPTLLRSDKIR